MILPQSPPRSSTSSTSWPRTRVQVARDADEAAVRFGTVRYRDEVVDALDRLAFDDHHEPVGG